MFLKKVVNIVERAAHELNKLAEEETPESFAKGKAFEDYVEKTLFPDSCYGLVHKTHSYEVNSERFVESSVEPDYKFRDKKSGELFYVEVKYRSGLYKGKVEWCTYPQLKRYKGIDEQTPTFLLLGVGGVAAAPKKIALVPMRDINYTGLFPNVLDSYLVNGKAYIDPGLIELYLKERKMGHVS